MATILIRGHHLSHFARYLHTGEIRNPKSPKFTANVVSLFEQIKNDPLAKISVINTLDSVCKNCEASEVKKMTRCMHGEYQDNRCIKLLGFSKGETYSQKRFINLVYAIPKRYWE